MVDSLVQEMVRGEKPAVSLTEREQEVLRLLALGHTNKEIAESMMISTDTAKTHVSNILTKLNLAHRTQAVVYALKHSLISLDEIEL